MVADREEMTVVTGIDFRAEFTNRGAQLVSFQLLEHDSGNGQVDLVRARTAPPYAFGLVDRDGTSAPLNDATVAQYQKMMAMGLGDLDKSGVAELTFKGRSLS